MHNHHPSWDYPIFIMLDLIFYLIGGMIGWSLFWTIMVFCLWRGLSPQAYETLHQAYPDLERVTYIANMLIIPVVLPLLTIAIYALFTSL